MAIPTFTMRQLLEAGVHFGHQTRRWNPKMGPYLFGIRNGVHIIDLQQTVPLLYRALEFIHDIVSNGGRILFVGTKRQAAIPLSDAAKRCGQYYVNHRWLGGMLTNWKTISNSIARLKTLDDQLAEENLGLTKKELLNLTRERNKLDRALGGIREMGGVPDAVFVIDTIKEEIAKHEANKLGIPVVAIIDSNSDPDNIQYPIPGNDDATRAISTYCDLIAQAVLGGLQKELSVSGADVGAEEVGPTEVLLGDGDDKKTPDVNNEGSGVDLGAEETGPTEVLPAEGDDQKTPDLNNEGSGIDVGAEEAGPTEVLLGDGDDKKTPDVNNEGSGVDLGAEETGPTEVLPAEGDDQKTPDVNNEGSGIDVGAEEAGPTEVLPGEGNDQKTPNANNIGEKDLGTEITATAKKIKSQKNTKVVASEEQVAEGGMSESVDIEAKKAGSDD